MGLDQGIKFKMKKKREKGEGRCEEEALEEK